MKKILLQQLKEIYEKELYELEERLQRTSPDTENWYNFRRTAKRIRTTVLQVINEELSK